MTAFITRFLKSDNEWPKRLRIWLAALLMALASLSAWADDEAQVRYAEIVPVAEGYVVNADIDLPLNPRVVDAISRGVSLYFRAEFRLERPRWYWLNEVILERYIDYRLSYHAITRNYRLSIGNLHQSFDTLEAAVRTMSTIRNWHVAESGKLQSGVSYRAALRMRLDTGRLPRPFQVTAIGSNDWHIGTDWSHWSFLAGAIR